MKKERKIKVKITAVSDLAIKLLDKDSNSYLSTLVNQEAELKYGSFIVPSDNRLIDMGYLEFEYLNL